VDQDAVRRDWQARGFSCGLWTDPPGARWEGYVHAADELLMVVDGAVELVLNGEILRPVAGVEVLIPAGVVDSVRNIGNTTSHWLYGYRH
jgi:quercetin dioxygenase-like cupin family protein